MVVWFFSVSDGIFLSRWLLQKNRLAFPMVSMSGEVEWSASRLYGAHGALSVSWHRMGAPSTQNGIQNRACGDHGGKKLTCNIL